MRKFLYILIILTLFFSVDVLAFQKGYLCTDSFSCDSGLQCVTSYTCDNSPSELCVLDGRKVCASSSDVPFEGFLLHWGGSLYQTNSKMINSDSISANQFCLDHGLGVQTFFRSLTQRVGENIMYSPTSSPPVWRLMVSGDNFLEQIHCAKLSDCPTGQELTNGFCKRNNGEKCILGEQCLSSVCKNAIDCSSGTCSLASSEYCTDADKFVYITPQRNQESITAKISYYNTYSGDFFCKDNRFLSSVMQRSGTLASGLWEKCPVEASGCSSVDTWYQSPSSRASVAQLQCSACTSDLQCYPKRCLARSISSIPTSLCCTDGDGDGFSPEEGNCGATDTSDAISTTYPGAPELCNNVDDDLNLLTDEGCDDDKDGYADSLMTCIINFKDGNGQIKQCATNAGDCDDTKSDDPPIGTAAGQCTEGCPTDKTLCSSRITTDKDCAKCAICQNPNAPEITTATNTCTDGVDNNCNGEADYGPSTANGNKHGDVACPIKLYSVSGSTSNGGEVSCDASGIITSFPTTLTITTTPVLSCTFSNWAQGAFGTPNELFSPRQIKVYRCSGMTQGTTYSLSCGIAADKAYGSPQSVTGSYTVPCPLWYRDQDADGFGNPFQSLRQCSQPSGYVSNNLDCCDTGTESSFGCSLTTKALIKPGATEVCDGVDNDCSGGTNNGDTCLCTANPTLVTGMTKSTDTQYTFPTVVTWEYKTSAVAPADECKWTCSAGYAQNVNTCLICPIGTSSTIGSTSCTNCGAGTYSSVVGSTSCTTCQADYYCPGASDRIACPVFSTTKSAGGQDAKSDCVCDTGYTKDSNGDCKVAPYSVCAADSDCLPNYACDIVFGATTKYCHPTSTACLASANDNPTAYFNFNTNTIDSVKSIISVMNGETRNDASGTAIVSKAGKYGSSSYYSGSTFLTAPSINPSGTAMSITGWVKSDVNNEYKGVYQFVNKKISFAIGDNLVDGFAPIGFYVSPQQYQTMSLSASNNQNWRHFAGTYDGTTPKLYIDGIQQTGEKNTGTGFNKNTNLIYFGASENFLSNKLQGNLDEIRYYDKTLSQSDVLQDMNSPYPISRPLGSWSFNSGKQDTHYYGPGRAGDAIELDGTDDWIDYTNDAAFDLQGSYTYSVWVKIPTSESSGPIISQRSSTDGDPIFDLMLGFTSVDIGAGEVALIVGGDTQEGLGTIDSGYAINDNKWHNIVVVKDVVSDQFILYIDKIEKGRMTDNTNSITTNMRSIGSERRWVIPTVFGTPEQGFLKGSVDEFRVYKKALTQAEINDLNDKVISEQTTAVANNRQYTCSNRVWTDAGCIPGYEGTTTCTACPTGKYKDSSMISCQACPSNSHSAVGSDDIADCLCNTGYHTESALCVSNTQSCTIPNGQGQKSWNTQTSTWGDCLVLSCNAGFEPSGDTKSCNACSLGKYKSTIDATACLNCPGGTYGITTGLTINTCSGSCTGNFYCPAGSSSATQNSCPLNSVSQQGSDEIADCICNSGFEKVGNECKKSVNKGCTSNSDCATNNCAFKPGTITSGVCTTATKCRDANGNEVASTTNVCNGALNGFYTCTNGVWSTLTSCSPVNTCTASTSSQVFTGSCLAGVCTTIAAPIESCDAKDNNCDGSTNEGLLHAGPLNALQIGVCLSTKQSCNAAQTTWLDDYSGIPDYQTIESTCTDNLDNDCDSKIDYDTRTSSSTHGDESCPVSVIDPVTISKSTNIIAVDSIDVTCTTSVANVNSIFAYVDNDNSGTFTSGDVDCGWNQGSGWAGTKATFKNCNVGLQGAKKVSCGVYSSSTEPFDRSFQDGTDKSVQITVNPSSCSGLSQTVCGSFSEQCEWFSGTVCNSDYQYNALAGSCINKGTSQSYACTLNQCNAECSGSSNGNVCPENNRFKGCDLTNCQAQCCPPGDHVDNAACVNNACQGQAPTGSGVSQGSSSRTIGPLLSWTYSSSATVGVCEWTCQSSFHRTTETATTCESNTRSCTSSNCQNGNPTTGIETWSNDVWGTCSANGCSSCNSGFKLVNSFCAPIVCTTPSPTNALLCTNDAIALNGNTDVISTVVNACTDEQKCEYICNARFFPLSNNCVSCIQKSHCGTDGWVESSDRQWVRDTICTEKEQKKENFITYSCSSNACSSVVTSSRWVDITGSTRNVVKDTDPYNDCSAIFNSCSTNKCQKLGPYGMCDGFGACKTDGNSANVGSGKVCSSGLEVSLSQTDYCSLSAFNGCSGNTPTRIATSCNGENLCNGPTITVSGNACTSPQSQCNPSTGSCVECTSSSQCGTTSCTSDSFLADRYTDFPSSCQNTCTSNNICSNCLCTSQIEICQMMNLCQSPTGNSNVKCRLNNQRSYEWTEVQNLGIETACTDGFDNDCDVKIDNTANNPDSDCKECDSGECCDISTLKFKPANSACSDSSECTSNDRCTGSSDSCTGTPVICPSANTCTLANSGLIYTGACTPAAGCDTALASSEICNDGIDNNCNGEQDYDDRLWTGGNPTSAQSGKHGDSSCSIEIKGITAPSEIIQDQEFTLACESSIPNVNSVVGYIDVNTNNKYDANEECYDLASPPWTGNKVGFKCKISASGTKSLGCGIYTDRSYQATGTIDKFAIIKVNPSNCNLITTQSECSQFPSVCTFCQQECDGKKRYSNFGTCQPIATGCASPSCTIGSCGAECNLIVPLASQACKDKGYFTGSASCNNDCTINILECSNCGDNNPNNAALAFPEQCDDGNNNELLCTNQCQKTFCGDGIKQTPNGFGVQEQCDDGVNNKNEADKCRVNCQNPICGDSIKDSNEQCDAGTACNGKENLDTCTTKCSTSCTTCIDSDGDRAFATDNCGTTMDCNDNDPEKTPGKTEVCDAKDNDCNGEIDEDDAGTIGAVCNNLFSSVSKLEGIFEPLCCEGGGVACHPETADQYCSGNFAGQSAVGTHLHTLSFIFSSAIFAPGYKVQCDLTKNDGVTATIESTITTPIVNTDYPLDYILTTADTAKITLDPQKGFLPWTAKECRVLHSNGVLLKKEMFDSSKSRIYVRHAIPWTVDDITRAVSCMAVRGSFFDNTGLCSYDSDVLFTTQSYTGADTEKRCNKGMCSKKQCEGVVYNNICPRSSSQRSNQATGAAITGWLIASAGIKEADNLREKTFAINSKPLSIQTTQHIKTEGHLKMRLMRDTSEVSSLSFTLTNLPLDTTGTPRVYDRSGENTEFTLSVDDSDGDGQVNIAISKISEYKKKLDIVLDFPLNQKTSTLETFNSAFTFSIAESGSNYNNANAPEQFIYYFDANAPTNMNEGETNAVGEFCADGVDNDLNYRVDCFDANCNGKMGPQKVSEINIDKNGLCQSPNEITCNDEYDNDWDGVTDCHDSDCFRRESFCPLTETICNDALNNDWDYTKATEPTSNNNHIYSSPEYITPITDCRDPECDTKKGDSANNVCSLNFECGDGDTNCGQKCSDGFDNDGLQMLDCQTRVLDSKATPIINDGEYDCSVPCRQITPGTTDKELGIQCFDGRDNDLDAVKVETSTTGSPLTGNAQGIDCRWTAFNPDEDCMGQKNAAENICELGKEVSCTDTFDNDFDKDDPGRVKPRNDYTSFLTEAIDCDDYDCAGKDNCPTTEKDILNGRGCFDGVDNDLDAFILNTGVLVQDGTKKKTDCGDPDCEGVTNPDNSRQRCLAKEFDLEKNVNYCSNGYDDDADGKNDCEDPDCNGVFKSCGPCSFEENITWNACFDRIDNNYRDGIDLTDPTCKKPTILLSQTGAYYQETETSCEDGVDNDGDGMVDCLDSSCAGKNNCEFATETSCTDDIDNDADGGVDCGDTNCYLHASCNLNAIAGLPMVDETTLNGQVNDISDKMTITYTSKVRKGKEFVMTFSIPQVSGTLQITLGNKISQPFPQSLLGTARLSGGDSDKFMLTQDSQQIIITKVGSISTVTSLQLKIPTVNPFPVTDFELVVALSPYSPSTSNIYSLEVLENNPPTINNVIVEPSIIESEKSITLQATVTDPSGSSPYEGAIGKCTFEVKPPSGNPTTLTSTECKTSFIPPVSGPYEVKTTAYDQASNTASRTETIQINLKPKGTAITGILSSPFYKAGSAPITITTIFLSADEIKKCAVMQNSIVIVPEFDTSSNICTATFDPSGWADGMYLISFRGKEADGDSAFSYPQVIYMCNSLESKDKVSGKWDCAYADFDQDKATEGIPSIFTGKVCDNCPTIKNNGQEDYNADGEGGSCSATDSCGNGVRETTASVIEECDNGIANGAAELCSNQCKCRYGIQGTIKTKVGGGTPSILPSANVNIFTSSGISMGTTTTDSTGFFKFNTLTASGGYDIEIVKDTLQKKYIISTSTLCVSAKADYTIDTCGNTIKDITFGETCNLCLADWGCTSVSDCPSASSPADNCNAPSVCTSTCEPIFDTANNPLNACLCHSCQKLTDHFDVPDTVCNAGQVCSSNQCAPDVKVDFKCNSYYSSLDSDCPLIEPKAAPSAEIKVATANNVITTSKIVSYKGKPIKLVVAVWE